MDPRAAALIAVWAPALLGAAHDRPRAAGSDRVGFPSRYQERFQVVRTVSKKEELQVGTVYANERAASVTTLAQLPCPYGSILVMEWRAALTDSGGQPTHDADGNLQEGAVARLDMMRREEGFGEAYGGDRTAEWEYASYRPDGSYATAPAETISCARCHVRAGAGRDFVFQTRFPAAASP